MAPIKESGNKLWAVFLFLPSEVDMGKFHFLFICNLSFISVEGTYRHGHTLATHGISVIDGKRKDAEARGQGLFWGTGGPGHWPHHVKPAT